MPDDPQLGPSRGGRYGGAEGFQYGGTEGANYGARDEWGWRIVLEDRTDQPRVIRGELLSVEINGEHTAQWGATIELPPTLDIRNYRGGAPAIYRDGRLLVRCPTINELKKADDGTITIGGLGPASELTDYAVDRTFRNLTAHEAIRRVIEDDTPQSVSATVRRPEEDPIDGELLQLASGRADFEQILTGVNRDRQGQFAEQDGTGGGGNFDDTEPFTVVEQGVRQLQDCFVREAEDYDSANSPGNFVRPTSSTASGGRAVRFEGNSQTSYSFTNEYTMPRNAARVGLRASHIPDAGGDTNARIEVELDGEQVWSRSFSALTANDLQWYQTRRLADTLDSGDHEVGFRVVNWTSGDGSLLLDVFAVHDSRHQATRNFPNTIQESGGNQYLTGPKPHAMGSAATFEFDPPAVGSVVESATADIQVTDGDSVTDAPEDRNSLDIAPGNGPATNTTNDGTLSKTRYFGAHSSDIAVRVGLAPANESDKTTTPARGTIPQTLTRVEFRFSGPGIPAIDERELSATNAFDALQTLCDDYGFIFVTDVSQADGVHMDVFQRGDSRELRPLPPDMLITEQDDETATDDFANSVTVVGGPRPNRPGKRYRWTERDEESIQNVGEVSAPRIEDESLTSLNDVRAAARAELDKRLAAVSRGGTFSTTPDLVAPGYPRQVPGFGIAAEWGGMAWGEFDWGGTIQTTLTTSTLSESAGDASTNLDFTLRDETLIALLAGVGAARA